jgi:peptide deformylase
MIKSIVTNIAELRKSCELVAKNENIKEILQDLKDTCIEKHGTGLAANQIGINKRISYVRLPKNINNKIEFQELYMINARFLDKRGKFTVKGEQCLSFPGIKVETDRYIFIIVEFENEKRELQTMALQDYEALIIQHEVSHQNGKTIFDYKHKAR